MESNHLVLDVNQADHHYLLGAFRGPSQNRTESIPHYKWGAPPFVRKDHLVPYVGVEPTESSLWEITVHQYLRLVSCGLSRFRTELLPSSGVRFHQISLESIISCFPWWIRTKPSWCSKHHILPLDEGKLYVIKQKTREVFLLGFNLC